MSPTNTTCREEFLNYILRFTIRSRLLGLAAILLAAFSFQHSASAFEGRISATLTRGGETQTFLYTVGTNQLRIERGETNWPHAKNILTLDTGARTLSFPHNRSFVRLKPATENASAHPPGFPGMTASLPPGIGPQAAPDVTPGAAGISSIPTGIGPTNLTGFHPPPQVA